MKKYILAAVFICVPLAFSLIGLIFGTFDDWWVKIGVPEANRPLVTVGLSITLLLVGHILSVIALEVSHDEAVETKFRQFEQSLNASLSGVSGLRVCQTSDAALSYVTARLPHARKVWNTRVPAPGVGDYASPQALKYSQTVTKVVDRGVHFRDVVGSVFSDRAKQMLDRRSEKGADNYCYVLVDAPNSPFFNFIVLEEESGFREVVFGWIITPVRGFEQECFVSHNGRLIDMFISLHDYMISSRTT